MHRFSASRSAVPLVTGNAPSAEMIHPMGAIFQMESLPMKRRRRLVTAAARGVSTFER